MAERTIAGLPGVVYRVRQDRKTTDPKTADECAWGTDDVSAQTELVFEAGTNRPLERSHTVETTARPDARSARSRRSSRAGPGPPRARWQLV